MFLSNHTNKEMKYNLASFISFKTIINANVGEPFYLYFKIKTYIK